MSWERRIVQWGNSLAVRLPSKLFRKTSWKEGDPVEFKVVDEDTVKILHAEEE
jgi:antitoxin component of MazEF toxin-antitoxin module